MPPRSLYHHFPGGKADVAAASITWVVTAASQFLADARARGVSPQDLVLDLFRGTARWLQRTDWEQGALLAVLAQEVAVTDPELCRRVADGYATITNALVEVLAPHTDRRQARELAATLLATLDGAVCQARVARSGSPLLAASRRLAQVLPS